MQVNKNENGHDRGLHVVIINPFNGNIESSQAYDTYETSVGFDQFITKTIPEGYIVVAASKDDCVTKMSQNAK